MSATYATPRKNSSPTPATGRVIIDFKNGEVVAVLPICGSDEEAQSLMKQLAQAAAVGDLTGIAK
jgi:hypothetical protein